MYIVYDIVHDAIQKLTINWTDRDALLDIRCVNVDDQRHWNFVRTNTNLRQLEIKSR